MGNFFTANVNQIKQTATNETYQSVENICTADCQQIQSGNTVFIDGSTVGNIIFDQECTANAGCEISNSLEALTQILLDLKQQNKTEASLFPNFGTVQLNVSEQEIRNRVQQLIENSCSATVDQVQADNLIYVRNSTTGDIGFKQEGNANADCIMSNIAVARANLQAKGDQSNTVAGIGLGGILGLVLLAVIIIIILAVVTRVGKATKGAGGGGASLPTGSIRPPPTIGTGRVRRA